MFALRIKPRTGAISRKEKVAQEILKTHELGPVSDPLCVEACPDYSASSGCHRDCEKAPLRLSSDPDAFPLEPLIAPLVFELKKLGVFYPS